MPGAHSLDGNQAVQSKARRNHRHRNPAFLCRNETGSCNSRPLELLKSLRCDLLAVTGRESERENNPGQRTSARLSGDLQAFASRRVGRWEL
jgi:hypothetical protein